MAKEEFGTIVATGKSLPPDRPFRPVRWNLGLNPEACRSVWVINQSLLASATQHPVLCQRGGYEVPFIRRVADELATRCALVPWQAQAPVGVEGLEQVVTT